MSCSTCDGEGCPYCGGPEADYHTMCIPCDGCSSPMARGHRPEYASGFAVDPGPFRIYRNLNKHCWSVQGRQSGGWRVIDHRKALIVADVTFKVSEAGRQRVLSTGRKNVHAYICTTEILATEVVLETWTPFTYDPRKHSTFVTLDGRPISKARAVALTFEGRAFAHQPT